MPDDHPDRDDREARDCVSVDVDGDTSLVDLLGLIEFARIDICAPAILDTDE